MLRDPSIHVTRSTLIKLLAGAGIDKPTLVADKLMRAAMPYNLKDRYIVTGDTELQKKAKKLIAASQNTLISAEQFNRILFTCRTNAGHRGIKPLRVTDTMQWTLLKEIAQLASEFSTVHGIDVHQGAESYIKLGLALMKHNYALGKFKYYDEKINGLYIAADMVQNDPEKETTAEVYELWKKLMKKYSNFVYELKRMEEYVNMVYIRMEADAIGAQYIDWLLAQFEFFTVFDNVPTLPQLITDNARQRYYEYMSKKKGKKQVIKNDTTDYKSEFEQRYFEAYRAKLGTEN